MSTTKLLRAFVLAGVPTAIGLSCTVADKDDYTFDDNPGGEGPAGGASGSGGKAGGGNASGGTAGGGRAGMSGGGGDAQAGAESGGQGGAGEGGGAGSGATGGGEAGEAGSGGQAGDAGSGGAPGNPCDPDPCEHGQCAPVDDGFECRCAPGYEGPRCEDNVDDCTPDPCQNGGACSDLVDDYACDCTGTGYTGKDCTVPPGASCSDDPCLHGVCTDVSGGGFRCDCSGTGFEGDTCATDIDECARELDNCDPLADCEDHDGTFKCTCPAYYQDVNGDGTVCKLYESCAAIHAAYRTAPTGNYPMAYPFPTTRTHGYCDMSTGGGGWTNIDFQNSVIYLENDNWVYCAQGISYDSVSVTCTEPYANGRYFLYHYRCDGGDNTGDYILHEIAPYIGHQAYGLGGFRTLRQAYESGYPTSLPYYEEYCYVDGGWYLYSEEQCAPYQSTYPNGDCAPSYFVLSL